MNLTPRGWALALSAVVAVAAAALFGIQELYPLGAAAAALVIFGALRIGSHRFDLTSERRLRPARVAAGEPAVVELSVTNRSRRRSPLVSVLDPFDGGAIPATFRLAPLRPGERLGGSYRLAPLPRGRYLVGPLEVRVTDPFEVVRRSRYGAPASQLTVHPEIVALSAPPSAGSADRFGRSGRGAVTAGGEEFSSLRPFRDGDDLRRVHWASTARLDQVMVRQTDALSHPRCTVAVDLREESWPPALLEEALAAAGSVLDAARRSNIEIRLVTTAKAGSGSSDTGFGASGAHWHRVLDALATAHSEPAPGGVPSALALALRSVGRVADTSAEDTLTVITSWRASESDRLGLARLASRTSLIVAVFGADDPNGPASAQPPGRSFQVTDRGGFARAWSELFPAHSRLVAP